jgi:mevalonate kinase
MLMGEHAVLHGFPCLVAAIDRRVRVSIIPRNDGLVTITSALGEYEGDRNDLPDHPSFRFVLGAMRHLPSSMPGGLDAAIHAEMPATIGFGTSAAVTAAMVGALHVASQGSLTPASILSDTRTVIQHVQGRGSGADAAASIYGGIVHYRMNDKNANIVTGVPHPITALYCGYKTPTPDVIAKVNAQWADRPEALTEIYTRMGILVEEGASALSSRHHSSWGKLLNDANGLMQELGVSTPELEECVKDLRNQPSITGAKISGSGLGDCAIGWGRAKASFSRFEQFDIVTAQEGLRIE